MDVCAGRLQHIWSQWTTQPEARRGANLPTSITAGANSSAFAYGAWRNRSQQVAVTGGLTETTVYVAGLLEQVTKGGLTEYRHLIGATPGTVAMLTRRSNATSATHYLHRDHLGSPELITDAAGAPLVKLSFAAYGARRDSSDWDGPISAADLATLGNTTRHGFTGHEHLDGVGLIHMGGRVYDPLIGRFLSRDPYIDGVASSQGANGYAYVWNNPLSRWDPSGFGGESPDVKTECNGDHDCSSGIDEVIVTSPRWRQDCTFCTDYDGLSDQSRELLEYGGSTVTVHVAERERNEAASEDTSPQEQSDESKRRSKNCPSSNTGIDFLDDILNSARDYGSLDITFNAGLGWGVNAQLSFTSRGVSGSFGVGWGIGWGISATAGPTIGEVSGFGGTVSYAGGTGSFGGAISGSVSQGGKGANAGVGWGVGSGASATVGYTGMIVEGCI